MYSTVASHLLATTLANCDRINIRTPQRKAKYSDKTRVRLKDLKSFAFTQCGWKSTQNIKKYLKVLGIKLDLRLTAAWRALVFELKLLINTAKSILEAITTPVPLTDIERLDRAKNSGAIADFQEDSVGGMYWVWDISGDINLVTSSGLVSFLQSFCSWNADEQIHRHSQSTAAG